MKIIRFANNYFQVVLCIMLFGLLGAAGWYTYQAEHVANASYSTVVNAVNKPSGSAIKSFNDCAAAGNAISQTYPETCTASDGQTYTQIQ